MWKLTRGFPLEVNDGECWTCMKITTECTEFTAAECCLWAHILWASFRVSSLVFHVLHTELSLGRWWVWTKNTPKVSSLFLHTLKLKLQETMQKQLPFNTWLPSWCLMQNLLKAPCSICTAWGFCWVCATSHSGMDNQMIACLEKEGKKMKWSGSREFWTP